MSSFRRLWWDVWETLIQCGASPPTMLEDRVPPTPSANIPAPTAERTRKRIATQPR